MKIIKWILIYMVISLLITGCEPSVMRIVVSPSSISGNRGETIKFQAAVVGSRNPPQNVKWTVSGGVEGTTITPSGGILTIGKGETSETLVVTATSTIATRKSQKVNITVQNPIIYGPAGGIVFYDKGEYSNGWRYLEVAPASSEFKAEWGLYERKFFNTTESGKISTTEIIQCLKENGETGKVAQLCATMTINGFNDWFLPSKDEIKALYQFDRDAGRICGFVGKYIGGFDLGGSSPEGWYWTSSTEGWWGSYALSFEDGQVSSGGGYASNFDNRKSELLVRAIRAY